MKNKIKSILITLLFTVFLSACGSSMDADTALLVNDTTVSKPVYQWYLIKAYDEASSMLPGADNIFSETIEGRPTKDWIRDKAIFYATRHVAIADACVKRNLKLSETMQSELDENLETFWNASGYFRYYSDFGIDETAFREILAGQKREELLYQYESEQLKNNITESDMQTYYPKHCAAIKYVAIPFPTTNDDSINNDSFNERIPDPVDTTPIYEEWKKTALRLGSLDTLMDEAAENEEYQNLGVSSSKSENSDYTLFYDSMQDIAADFIEALKKSDAGQIHTYEDLANQYWILYEKVDPATTPSIFSNNKDILIELIALDKFQDITNNLTTTTDVSENKSITRRQDLEELFSIP